MTEGWRTVEHPRLKLEMPTSWELLPSDRDEVVAIAQPLFKDTVFRANVVILLLESSETIQQLGARSISEALAYPGWSHVCSDVQWYRPDTTGRVVHFLYEASDMCVAVTRYGIVTGTHVVEITASCDVLDVLRLEDLFSVIAGSTRVKEMA
jgi:hypothetical protein